MFQIRCLVLYTKEFLYFVIRKEDAGDVINVCRRCNHKNSLMGIETELSFFCSRYRNSIQNEYVLVPIVDKTKADAVKQSANGARTRSVALNSVQRLQQFANKTSSLEEREQRTE